MSTAKTPTIAIVGLGLLGQAVARIFCSTDARVRLWARDGAALNAVHQALPTSEAVGDLPAACRDADVIFFAVPAQALGEVAAAYGEVAQPDHIVLHATRGVEAGFVLPHQIIRAHSCVRKIGVVGGPIYAPDLTSRRTLAAVLASRFDSLHDAFRDLLRNLPIRLHSTRDVIGVEVAGAIANVSALAVGMADALELGDTARGVLLTHGLIEASRLGRMMGAVPATFTGLAGIGDLIPRRVTSTQRHHTLGAELARGATLEDALQKIDGDVEGVLTANAAAERGADEGLQLPLVEAVNAVCHGERSAAEALEGVLRHDLDLGRGLGVA